MGQIWMVESKFWLWEGDLRDRDIIFTRDLVWCGE